MNAPFRTIFHETDWLISWWAISGVCAAVLSEGDLLALLSRCKRFQRTEDVKVYPSKYIRFPKLD